MCSQQYPAFNSVLLLLSSGWPPAVSDLTIDKTELIWTGTKHNLSKIPGCGRAWHLVMLTLPNQMTSVFSESNSRRICHSTSTSVLLVLSASFNYDNYVASDLGTSWQWVRDNLGMSWLGTSWPWVRVDCKPVVATSAWLMAITYYGLWLMDLLFKFKYCLLFVLFYLNFFILFGRI